MRQTWQVFVSDEADPSYTGLTFERAQRIVNVIQRLGGEAYFEVEPEYVADEQRASELCEV